MAQHQPWRLSPRRYLFWLLATALLVGCGPASPQRPAALQRTPAAASPAPASLPAQQQAITPTPGPAHDWVLGATPLARRPDGFGMVRSTPPVLINRRRSTVDRLPRPKSTSFSSTISPVPPQVLARSSWQPSCPVSTSQLRYLTLSFRGFDAQAHTGEMLVNADVAKAVVSVFKRLYAAGFPIEEMRITSKAELNAPPTGDGNNTEGFICRPPRGRAHWSAHAYGLAIDLNPFNNPYVHGDLVLPELASSYLERDWVRSGMTRDGGPAVTAFESIGWKWGGRWPGPVDFMHFSANGR